MSAPAVPPTAPQMPRPALDVDLHTHHARCGHAVGGLEDYVRRAIELGIEVLGLSDHAPLFADPRDHPVPGIQMARSEFPCYVEEAKRLRRAYAGDLRILVGIEADYVPGHEDVYREQLERAELDFVIGSVHAFGPFHVYQFDTWPSTRDRVALYRRYFEHVRGAVTSGLFDVLAHVDAIKVYGDDALEAVPDELAATLEAIVDSGITVEINTAGLRKCGEVFPRPSLLAELARRGVPLTYGSDAHAPAELLYGSGTVRDLCRAHGIEAFHHFSERRRERRPIPRLD